MPCYRYFYCNLKTAFYDHLYDAAMYCRCHGSRKMAGVIVLTFSKNMKPCLVSPMQWLESSERFFGEGSQKKQLEYSHHVSYEAYDSVFLHLAFLGGGSMLRFSEAKHAFEMPHYPDEPLSKLLVSPVITL